MTAKRTGAAGIIGQWIVRLYTLAVMGVVIWAGYTAVVYLYRSVFTPGVAPERLLAWQAATGVEDLQAGDAPGITEPAGRPPIRHYHAVDPWYQPTIRNGCITSGCHDPVPHSQSKELRAFANLHSTFMACETCHKPTAGEPMPAVWVDVRTGRKQAPPAILQLMAHLKPADTQPAQANLYEYSDKILSLLRQVIRVIDGDPVLEHIAVQIDTSEPGSPVWRQAMARLADELPGHVRGEYGARITPANAAADPQPIGQDFGPLVEQYFSRQTDQTARAALVERIHDGIIPKPEGCLPCHRGQPPVLDFAALGYPPQRIGVLTSTPIATMMQQIRQGQPFSLPLGP